MAGVFASPTWARERNYGHTNRRDAGYGNRARRGCRASGSTCAPKASSSAGEHGRQQCAYVPMSGIDHDGLRLPLGDGQHIFACGATGSGKTTTMRRVLAARTITQKAALLILDQKGDQEDVEQMSRLAGAAGRAVRPDRSAGPRQRPLPAAMGNASAGRSPGG